jgi:hypothetical protein
MKKLLEGLHAVEGVQGSLVVDGTGQLLAYQAHALYDATLLEQVCKTIISAVDAVALLNEHWDAVTSTYTDGTLTLRNLKPGGAAAGRTVVLGLIGDARLNASFAGVAIRVAATKLKAFLENPNSLSSLGASQVAQTASSGMANPALSGVTPPGAQQGGRPPNPASSSTVELANSGLSWSGLGSSMRVGSDIQVADSASSAFLTACTKALAQSVGPMAKVFVKDAVRKLCPDRPFSRAMADGLVAILRAHIEDPDDLAQFQKKMRVYVG